MDGNGDKTTHFPCLEPIFHAWNPFSMPGTEQTTIFYWMFVETTIFLCKDLVHHPTETSVQEMVV